MLTVCYMIIINALKYLVDMVTNVTILNISSIRRPLLEVMNALILYVV